MDSGRIIKKIKGKYGYSEKVKFSSCGGYVATTLNQPFISLLAVGSWEIMKTLHATEVIKTFDYSHDQIAGVCGGQKNITLWSVETGAVKRVLQGHSNTINSIAFSAHQ